jgi:hypothetical protein
MDIIKPDITAPGVSILAGNSPAPSSSPAGELFQAIAGTSMSSPHIAGVYALLKQAHPDWSAAMAKSAIMTTARQDVFKEDMITKADPFDMGAGRIDLTKAGNPGLVLDKPSLSGGETSAGQTKTITIRAQNISGRADTWDVSGIVTTAGLSIAPASPTLILGAGEWGTIPVTIGTGAGTATGNYEGSLVLVSRAMGTRLHIPAWLRVIPPKSMDVLVIDADGKATGVAGDVRPPYTAMLDSLGLTYTVGFPTNPLDLHRYRAVVVFTGDNAVFANSGFTVAQEDALADYLDSGGRVWVLGQNMALGLDSGTYHSQLDRGRLYSGYLGLAYEADSVNTAGTAGLGPFAGMPLGLSQTSVEGTSSPAFDTDTYNSRGTTKRFFQTGGGNAVSHGRSSDPTLEEERQDYLYRSVSMGFGIEGLTDHRGPARRPDDGLAARPDHGWARLGRGRPRQAGHAGRKRCLQRRGSDHEVPLGLRRRLRLRHDGRPVSQAQVPAPRYLRGADRGHRQPRPHFRRPRRRRSEA